MVLFLLTFTVAKTEYQTECLRTNSQYGSPQLQNYLDTELNSALIPHHRQAIITSYKFDCYGNITEWRLATRGYNTIASLSLQFQVWRPSPSVETNGCYSLVGCNRFTIVLQNHSIVIASPLPEDRVEFAPGDVLGFYVESGQGDGAAGVTVLSDFSERGDKSYESEEVWYGTVPDIIINPDPNCLFRVGPSGHLNTSKHAAPVISVSYDKSQPIYSERDFISVTKVPSQEETVIVITGATAATVVTVTIITLFIVLAACIKRGKCCHKDSATNNEAHETASQGSTNDPIYDLPIVFDIKENVAYATITRRVHREE